MKGPRMPELPDITIYVEALERRIVGERLIRVSVRSPFLLRTFDPPLESAHGRLVREVRRLGKRIALGLEDEQWLILHLMIAGRLRWTKGDVKLAGKAALAAFEFSSGTLVLTEAGTKHRAALHVVRGPEALAAHDPGGLEVLAAGYEQFQATLRRQNHTLKRALTDPRLFSGIGNAYSERPTTARAARPAAGSSPIGLCRACSRNSGRATSTSFNVDSR